MSGISGHDALHKQRPVVKPKQIWKLDADGWTQDPQEPVFGGDGDGNGSTILRFFADEYLRRGTATDVAFIKCPNRGETGRWRDGVRSWPEKAVQECKAIWTKALASGGQLAGIIVYCCEGDADNDAEVEEFPARFAAVVERFRVAADSDLPVVLTQIELLQPCRYSQDYQSRLGALRAKMARVFDYVPNAQAFLTDPTWPRLNSKSCVHLDGTGQEMVGRGIAKIMP